MPNRDNYDYSDDDYSGYDPADNDYTDYVMPHCSLTTAQQLRYPAT